MTVPRDLLRELGLEPGQSQVYWIVNPDMAGTLVLIPAPMIAKETPKLVAGLKRQKRPGKR